MATLGVNIDHIATVRQARRTDEPDPVWAAVEAQLGGASCITFHLREDQRHITDRDLDPLKAAVNVKLNMEMSIASAIVARAGRLRPTQCTLVPERREELTTEGGLDVVRLRRRVAPAVRRLKSRGIILSAFIEPIPEQIEVSAEIGFDAVELWTGAYAHARRPREVERALDALRDGIDVGRRCGLEVHGGHGLTYRNIGPVASLPGFSEFNIGHSIIARAVFVGLREAVREMNELLIRFAPTTGAWPPKAAAMPPGPSQRR
jgi:pyridoxine 5-phosphate synthase